MPLRTQLLFDALGSEEALEIAVVLLREPQTVGGLVKATGLSQATVSRRILALRTAGAVEPSPRKGLIRVRDPVALRLLLRSVSELASQLNAHDAADEDAFRQRLDEPE
jgi:DNA-binding transcriptional ArsR family regulator